MGKFRQIANFSIFSAVLGFMLPVDAVVSFDSIRVSNLTGTNDSPINTSDDPTGRDFADDIFLEQLTFTGTGGANFSSSSSFSAVDRLTVLSGREDGSRANVNGESGFSDDNSDGDPDNFAKVGLDINTDQESTDPAIQDPGLLSALNNRSLTEIADGEGAQPYELQITFTQGLADNSNGDDNVPELILFERGINDLAIEVELITGGTFENPTFGGSTFSLPSSDYDDTGINIRTREIGGFQDVGVIGLDLSEDFSFTSGDPVFGVILRSTSGGADINGVFLAAEDPNDFVDVPLGLGSEPIPFEAEGTIGFLALGGYLWYRKHKKQKLSQQSDH